MHWNSADPGWKLIDIPEHWAFREVLLVLTGRTLTVRYRQAIAGVAWAVVRPLAMLLLFQTFFQLLGVTPASTEYSYAVSTLVGLLLWQLFSGAVADATQCFVANRNLLTKVRFPRLFLPTSSVLVAVVDFCVALLLLPPLMWWEGVIPSWPLLTAPLFITLTVLAALACSIWLSALNAMLRDIGHAVPFALQLGFFVTPVTYQTASIIPEKYRWMYGFNPIATSIEGLRWSVAAGPAPEWPALMTGMITICFLLVTGLLYFRRVEAQLADVV